MIYIPSNLQELLKNKLITKMKNLLFIENFMEMNHMKTIILKIYILEEQAFIILL